MKQIQLLLLSLLLVLLSSCVTQKKKGDLTAVQKLYHNTTAKYNGYFNANVLLNESIAKLDEDHQDNYNQILNMYEYVATDDPKSAVGELDEAIKKVSIVVSLHREAQWTDDCYLLIGKAQYVKQDYESAESTLRYMAENYSPEAMAEREAKLNRGKKKGRKKSSSKKRKKKKKKPTRKKATPKKKGGEEPKPTKMAKDGNKPDSYFMKHRPAFQEGQLWMARTLIEREKYDEARRIMRTLNEDPQTFKDIRADLAAVDAYFFLKQKEYEKSVSPLAAAIELAESRKNKARFSYILAQLHQRAGRSAEAIAAFDAAKKYSTDYEMEFSAELSVTKNAWVTGQMNSEQVNKLLEKMLKDVKNYDYRDQIYFTLAEIAFKEGKKDLAIANYKKSAWFNTGNQSQKAEAYYQLASLYYADEIYVDAKYYYDSTSQVMPKNDERYSVVEFRNKNLTEIAANIQIIELQDSLLRVSQMSDDEKRELALNIYTEQLKAAEEAKKAAAAAAGPKRTAAAPAARFGQAGASATGVASNFFAYNDRSLKKGKKDFDRKWSSRQLEDNWRRSNKLGNSDIEDVAIGKDGRIKDIPDEEMEKILKGIPSTPEQVAEANKKIRDAMFKLGTLYRDRLEKNQKTVITLEDLLERYPGTDKELDSWYYLYLSHTDLGNLAKAQDYKNKIISKYPKTTYARVLEDPNFLADANAKEKELVKYYDETYNAFQQSQFKMAFDRISKAPQLFGPNNNMQPKFALLSAMCLGNLQGKDAYIKALREVVAKYPETAEQKRAKEILRLLGGSRGSNSSADREVKKEDPNASQKFKVDDNSVHYFIVVLEEKSKINESKKSVSDFNLKYHKLNKLRISNIYLGTNPGIPLLVIRRFKNKSEGMQYYESAVSKINEFVAGATSQIFLVSQNNYREILKSKSIEGYGSFFSENYLD